MRLRHQPHGALRRRPEERLGDRRRTRRLPPPRSRHLGLPQRSRRQAALAPPPPPRRHHLQGPGEDRERPPGGVLARSGLQGRSGHVAPPSRLPQRLRGRGGQSPPHGLPPERGSARSQGPHSHGAGPAEQPRQSRRLHPRPRTGSRLPRRHQRGRQGKLRSVLQRLGLHAPDARSPVPIRPTPLLLQQPPFRSRSQRTRSDQTPPRIPPSRIRPESPRTGGRTRQDAGNIPSPRRPRQLPRSAARLPVRHRAIPRHQNRQPRQAAHPYHQANGRNRSQPPSRQRRTRRNQRLSQRTRRDRRGGSGRIQNRLGRKARDPTESLQTHQQGETRSRRSGRQGGTRGGRPSSQRGRVGGPAQEEDRDRARLGVSGQYARGAIGHQRLEYFRGDGVVCQEM
mmetsp:Transcript_2226/g.4489  ORF Transcript_2226/g.4489 Transcript_2226/m.4489 type:complete len:397 (+) Transcript_2226:530-1720(+)